MPRENYGGPDTLTDPFYPDGYTSTDQDRAQIIAQKEKYAARVNSINFKLITFSFSINSLFFQHRFSRPRLIRKILKILFR